MSFFDFLLGRQLKNGPPPYNPVFAYDSPQVTYMPRDYAAYVREGYRKNGPLYRGVSLIAEGIAGIELGLYTDRSMSREITSHDLLDLLASPNPFQSQGEWIEHYIAYIMLSGNGYLYANRPTPNSPPLELWALRPDQMKVVAGKYGPAGYVYGVGGSEATYEVEEVSHFKLFSGNDPWYGLSPVEVAATMIDQLNAGLAWNVALMQNMARPSGAWVAKTVLNPNDFKKLKQEIKDKYSGARNAGLPAVLDAGLEWQNQSLTPLEADWLQSMNFDANGIANILGLAPELVGSGNRTYANMGEAREAMYEDKLFPLLDRVTDKLNMWLVPMFAKSGLYLGYKKDKVEAMRNRYEAAKKTVSDSATQNFINTICTLNEAREAQGLKPLPGGDVFKLGTNLLIPAEQLQEFAEKLAEKATTATPAPIMMQHPGAAGQIGPDQPQEGNKPDAEGDTQDKNRPGHTTKALNLQTQEQKAAYFASVEASRAAWVENTTDRMQNYFKQEYAAVVHAFHTRATPTTPVSSYVAGFKAALPGQELQRTIKGIYTDVGTAFGRNVASHFAQGRKAGLMYKADLTPDEISDLINNGPISFDLLSADTQAYLQDLAGKKVQEIDTKTLDLLRAALLDGVNAGESIPDLAKRIDALYLDQIIPNRSETIARTETIAASNYGSQEAANQAQAAGLQLQKVWLASGGPRTRPDHAAASGQSVALDQPYEVGGSLLMYPGDSSMGAAADEVVNCRCTEYYQEVTQTDPQAIVDPLKASYNTSSTLVRTSRQTYRDYLRV